MRMPRRGNGILPIELHASRSPAQGGFLFSAEEECFFMEEVRQPLCESSSITDGDRNEYSVGTRPE
jgi:hypothetical protein